MSAQIKEPTSPASDATPLFAVGDRVTAAETIVDRLAEDWPLQRFCKQGDVLVIHECRPNGWYAVAHPEVTDDSTFLARHRELSPANS